MTANRVSKKVVPDDPEDDETLDELDDPQLAWVKENDPDFESDCASAEHWSCFAKYVAYAEAREYWSDQRIWDYWMQARAKKGEATKASPHMEVSEKTRQKSCDFTQPTCD